MAAALRISSSTLKYLIKISLIGHFNSLCEIRLCDWSHWSYFRPLGEIKDAIFPCDVGGAALFPFAAVGEITVPSYFSLWLKGKARYLSG